MLRALRPYTILTTLACLSQTAAAERIAWTPLRLGFTAAVDSPTNSNFILTDFRIDIAQQIGGAAVDGNDGHGPFASVGGAFGLGLYTPWGNNTGCEDEVDPEDGSTRWTCGRLTLGGSVTVGWSWGSLLKSGYMLPQKTLYLQLTPYFAAVKNPEQSGVELDVTITAGYWWTWAGIGLRWSRIPGNDYYGVAIQLTKGFSDWFARDELVEPEVEKNVLADPPPAVRLELGLGAAYPVVKGNEGADGIATVHLGVYRRSSRQLQGSFTGIGGAISFIINDANGVHLGPAATIGSRSGVAGFYARVRPLLGARTIAEDTRFDYGVDAALGVSVGVPSDNLDGEVGDSSLGLELSAGWIAGDVFVGGNLQLVLF